jgi:hypothetical protein
MKKLNLFSLLSLIGIGFDRNQLTGLPVTTQNLRPSKYPPIHPVAIELMEKAQAKRERKAVTGRLNQAKCFAGNYKTYDNFVWHGEKS